MTPQERLRRVEQMRYQEELRKQKEEGGPKARRNSVSGQVLESLKQGKVGGALSISGRGMAQSLRRAITMDSGRLKGPVSPTSGRLLNSPKKGKTIKVRMPCCIECHVMSHLLVVWGSPPLSQLH